MSKEKTAQKDFLGLRTKREALGLTLKDVFSLTRVSVVNLEAIENGDFHNLPVPIYTRNFIKTYARALDLDSKPILDGYEAYLNSLQIAQTQIPETVPEREPSIKSPGHYKAYIAAAAIIIIIVVAFFIFQQHQPVPKVAGNPQEAAVTAPQAPASTPVNPPEQTKTVVPPVVSAEINKQTQAQPALPRQKSAAQLKSSPKQNAPGVEKTIPAVINEEAEMLVIKANEETWLRMKIDQHPSFQVLLKPGEEIERKGASFDLDIGNAGGIKIQFKGKSIENLGKSGQVIHLQLP